MEFLQRKVKAMKRKKTRIRAPWYKKSFLCPNCKKETADGHFVPPSLGEGGYFICDYGMEKPTDRPFELGLF